MSSANSSSKMPLVSDAHVQIKIMHPSAKFVWTAKPQACQQCKKLHGKIIENLNEVFHLGDWNGRPHPNCKCQLILDTKSILEDSSSQNHEKFDKIVKDLRLQIKRLSVEGPQISLVVDIRANIELLDKQRSEYPEMSRYIDSLIENFQQILNETTKEGGTQTACPKNLSEAEKSSDLYRYPTRYGELLFHCGYACFISKIYENALINECCYDEKGVLVTDKHEFSGCKGTPNEYHQDDLRHTFFDSGGILKSGWNAYWESREHQARVRSSDRKNAYQEFLSEASTACKAVASSNS